MAMFERVDLAFGWFEPFDDNELHLHSTNADPPKFRFSVDADQTDEGNLGGLSMNTRRPDSGELDEWVFVGARLIHDRTKGAFAIAAATRGPSGEPTEVSEVALFAAHAIVLNVPLEGPGARVPALRAPGGQTELHCQGDGNAVMYDVRPGLTVNGAPRAMVALSTLKGGEIRAFREDGGYAE